MNQQQWFKNLTEKLHNPVLDFFIYSLGIWLSPGTSTWCPGPPSHQGGKLAPLINWSFAFPTAISALILTLLLLFVFSSLARHRWVVRNKRPPPNSNQSSPQTIWRRRTASLHTVPYLHRPNITSNISTTKPTTHSNIQATVTERTLTTLTTATGPIIHITQATLTRQLVTTMTGPISVIDLQHIIPTTVIAGRWIKLKRLLHKDGRIVPITRPIPATSTTITPTLVLSVIPIAITGVEGERVSWGRVGGGVTAVVKATALVRGARRKETFTRLPVRRRNVEVCN